MGILRGLFHGKLSNEKREKMIKLLKIEAEELENHLKDLIEHFEKKNLNPVIAIMVLSKMKSMIEDSLGIDENQIVPMCDNPSCESCKKVLNSLEFDKTVN